jgi:rubredoxin
MRAVRADCDRQLDIVVHDQGYARGTADLEQRSGLLVPERRRCRLVPILDDGSTAPDRVAHSPGKRGRVRQVRRERIEAARESGHEGGGRSALARRSPARYDPADFNVPPFATQPLISMVETTQTYKTWMCLICGYIYDEAAGLPDEGLAPGTRWEDVPINWTCPECGARKDDFEMVEI